MFHQTFQKEIGFILKIKVHNLPQSKISTILKNFRGQCPRVRVFFNVCGYCKIISISDPTVYKVNLRLCWGQLVILTFAKLFSILLRSMGSSFFIIEANKVIKSLRPICRIFFVSVSNRRADMVKNLAQAIVIYVAMVFKGSICDNLEENFFISFWKLNEVLKLSQKEQNFRRCFMYYFNIKTDIYRPKMKKKMSSVLCTQ